MNNHSDGLAYQPIFTVSEKVYCSRSFLTSSRLSSFSILCLGVPGLIVDHSSLNFAQGYLQKKKLVFTANKGQNLPDFGLYY